MKIYTLLNYIYSAIPEAKLLNVISVKPLVSNGLLSFFDMH